MKTIRKKIYAILMSISLLLLFGCSLEDTATETAKVSASEEKLKVHFLDVGQGDSIFIELPNNETMLIDAGEYMYSSGVQNYIKKLGYSKINYIVGTHPHSDHVGGLSDIIKNFDFDKIYLPNAVSTTPTYVKLLEAIKVKGKKMTRAQKGVAIINDGKLNATIIGPVGENYENLNNYSVVIKLTYGANSFLLTGDMETLTEKELTDNLKADVLKAGHHGSNTSTSEDFLKKVSPKYTVISCGKDNDYGHPHEKVIERLKNHSVKIYRTDLNGTITFTSDSKNIKTDQEKTSLEDSSSQSTNTKPQAQTKYVLNTSSRKIHYSTCPSVNKISTDNRLNTNDYKKAISDGYAPCKSCKPVA